LVSVVLDLLLAEESHVLYNSYPHSFLINICEVRLHLRKTEKLYSDIYIPWHEQQISHSNIQDIPHCYEVESSSPLSQKPTTVTNPALIHIPTKYFCAS
jgi:hypothetical protein